ncbi:hypothetical protein [Pseudolysinimonas kribbensis]|uniref:hypothetical protein n=1 Tax=Pseudolysinimonas kribbensis TaxID=433641 RepID=UPI0024E0FADE|nr:hypothetical protein [Pseudolysinimonas kribbensis]
MSDDTGPSAKNTLSSTATSRLVRSMTSLTVSTVSWTTGYASGALGSTVTVTKLELVPPYSFWIV